MLKNRTVLPRLDYLLTFEVAAELESFAAAAKEMNVSETAISRKIKLLELHYNCVLFVRGHRSVRLTDQGRMLQQGIRDPLRSIARLSEDMLSKKSPSSVRLSATHSVASLWLMPRMTQFHEANKSIAINLVSSDVDEECLSDEFDLTILRGDGGWRGYDAQRLFGETIFPVCSPGYLENYRQIEDVTELSRHNLIEVNTKHDEWMNWRTWLERRGADPEQIKHSTSVNTYPLAVHAAIDGLGIALGWGHLVDRHLASGALVKPLGGAHVRTRSGYYLLMRKGVAHHPARDAVADWLLSESAARKRYTKRAFQAA